jgi:hypothetical protein
MINISIQSIPEEQHRYPTTGDWWFEPDGRLRIAVTEWGNPDHEFLIAFHELVEVWLCRRRGITTEAVDAFDMAYERNRREGDTSEPGDDPRAPYYREHQFASGMERLMAAELGVNWQEYGGFIEESPLAP